MSTDTDTDTETETETETDTEIESERRKAQRRDRLVLPLVLPAACIFVAVLGAANISRLFLAGPDSRAVVVATVITIVILAGAALISANGHVRSSSLVLGLSLGFVLIMSAGLVTFGAGEVHEEFGPQEPAGKVVNTFEVEASNFEFQADEFDLPAGVTEIDYVLIEGSHTLVFSEPELSYLELAAPGTPQKGKVDFEAGKTYTMYCTIASHRDSGMEATVTIGEAEIASDDAGATEAGDGTGGGTGEGGATTTTMTAP